MILYAESSAVISWLLGEPPGDAVRQTLDAASAVFSSDLTLVECDRTIHRVAASGRRGAVVSGRAKARLDLEVTPWTIHSLGPEVVDRARRGFPREPVRALDALHLATALLIRDIRPGLRLLSFDRRIRENAVALGFDVLPAEL